jgi:hypothetical protein
MCSLSACSMVVSAQPVTPSSGMVEAIGCLSACSSIDLERPGAGGDDAFVLEVVDLDHRIVPVAADQRALAAQQVERRLVLVFVELVGVLDAEFRLVVIR